MTVLIQPDELASRLRADHDRPAVLDVRWKLGGPPGHDEYLTGHVPGAVFVDLDQELAAHGEPTDGRHPLPSLEQLQEAARRWGLNVGDSVVVYDGEGNLSAARAWWLLRWAGISDVQILDGALPAWLEGGYPIDTDDVVPLRGNVELAAGGQELLDIDQVARFAHNGLLLDARAFERFTGQQEPIDPKAGHIPGAVSAPTGANLDQAGRFLTPERLRERFASVGADADTAIAVYCGSGVTAAHQIAALAIAGYDAALFPGSWSQWSNQDRPVATGE